MIDEFERAGEVAAPLFLLNGWDWWNNPRPNAVNAVADFFRDLARGAKRSGDSVESGRLLVIHKGHQKVLYVRVGEVSILNETWPDGDRNPSAGSRTRGDL
jgi:hypothetical protein